MIFFCFERHLKRLVENIVESVQWHLLVFHYQQLSKPSLQIIFDVFLWIKVPFFIKMTNCKSLSKPCIDNEPCDVLEERLTQKEVAWILADND